MDSKRKLLENGTPTLATSVEKQIKVKNKLQDVIDALNLYVLNNFDIVKFESDRRYIDTIEISNFVYSYLDLNADPIIKDNLKSLFKKIDGIKALNPAISKIDIAKQIADFEVFPRVNNGPMNNQKSDFDAEIKLPKMPDAIHGFYNCMFDILQRANDIKTGTLGKIVTVGTGFSDLRSRIINACAGYESVAEELGSVLYFCVFEKELAVVDVHKKPAKFANEMLSCLNSESIYQGETFTYRIKLDGKSERIYNVHFYLSREEAEAGIASYGNIVCVGLHAGFYLKKSNPHDVKERGVFVPDAAAMQEVRMEIWRSSSGHNQQTYLLDYDVIRKLLVILPTPESSPTMARKQ